MIDLSVDELRKVKSVQDAVTLRYMGQPNTLDNLLMMVGEMKERMADIGFVAAMSFQPTDDGNMVPICEIVGRTDPIRAKEVAEEGYDFERLGWESSHTSSDRLRKEGLDPDLLVG